MKSRAMYAALAVTILALVGCTSTNTKCSFTGSGGSNGDGGNGGSNLLGGFGGGLPAICHLDECDLDGTIGAKKEACNDRNPHTADRCIPTKCGGACAHVEVQCDHLDSIEMQQDLCDDNNVCTFDRCGDLNACAHLPIGNCDPCLSAACAAEQNECSIVYADCNEDGIDEALICGTCAPPEACGGSKTPGQCGDFCASKYEDDCTSAKLPAAWAFDASCDLVFKIIESQPQYCAGCAAIPGCQPLEINGTSILCCP